MFIAALFNSQDMEILQMPINRWMDKEDVILLRLWLSITLEYPLSCKKNEDSAIFSKVSGPRKYYA